MLRDVPGCSVMFHDPGFIDDLQNGGRRSRFFRNEFLQDSGQVPEAETSVSEKTECFLATSEDKKANLLK